MDRTATVSSYEDLIDALRARVDELGIPQARVDELVGWADGMTGKVLGSTMVKRLSPTTMWWMMQALSVSCVLQVDPELMARMGDRYARARRNERCRRVGNMSNALSAYNISRAAREMGRRGGSKAKQLALHTRNLLSRAGSNGGKARWRNVSKKARRELASQWAKRRWRKPRVAATKQAQ